MTSSPERLPCSTAPASPPEALIWSEKFGVKIWLVQEHTGQDRIEYTLEEARKFGQLLDAFGGEIQSITTPDGRTLTPVPGWEERVRRQQLADLKVEYDLGLAAVKDLQAVRDDPAIPWFKSIREAQRLKDEKDHLDRLVRDLRKAGHELTEAERLHGFAAVAVAAPVTPPEDRPVPSAKTEGASPDETTTDLHAARELLRKERLLAAIAESRQRAATDPPRTRRRP